MKALKNIQQNKLFPTPKYLPKLTPEEEMMICLIEVNVKIYVKHRGMPSIVGQIVHFPKDINKLLINCQDNLINFLFM